MCDSRLWRYHPVARLKSALVLWYTFFPLGGRSLGNKLAHLPHMDPPELTTSIGRAKSNLLIYAVLEMEPTDLSANGIDTHLSIHSHSYLDKKSVHDFDIGKLCQWKKTFPPRARGTLTRTHSLHRSSNCRCVTVRARPRLKASIHIEGNS